MARFAGKKSLIVLILLLALVAFRLVLPALLARAINRRLADLPPYRGRVASVRLALWRGEVRLEGFQFGRHHEIPPAAYFTARRVSLRLSPRALLRGRLAFNAVLERPRLSLLFRVRREGEARRVGLWQEFFIRLPPFRLDRLAVRDGYVRVANHQSIPRTDLFFDSIALTASGLANRADIRRPGSVLLEGHALLQGRAALRARLQAEPFQDHVVFTAAGRLEGFPLEVLNPYLEHYAGLRVSAGKLRVEGDFRAADGAFEGTVHRRLGDLEIRPGEEGPRPAGEMKAWAFESWVKWLKRRGEWDETFSLSGPLGDLDRDPLLAAVWVYRTAFLEALRPSPEGHVAAESPQEADLRWRKVQAEERRRAGDRR